MKLSRVTFALLGATVVLVASACGSGGGVPEGAVAVVDGTEISKAELDELIGVAKKAFESREQDFPKVGTPEYQSIQSQYLAFLVQREEFEQAAKKLGIEVTDKDVDEALAELIESRFDNDRKEFEKALEQQGFSEEIFRKTLVASVLSQKLFDKVTKDVEVADADVVAYYTQNQSQYQTPESRDVRHILVAEQGTNGQVDFAKSKTEAGRIYTALRGGGDFAALAKESSDDPGTKDAGGRLTISRGQTVPEFDKTAFALKEGAISRPVKTQYGYHVIEALSPVRPAKTTKIGQVRESIRATLLQEKRNEAMTAWVEKLREDYEGKVKYATGLEPPELPDTPTETE